MNKPQLCVTVTGPTMEDLRRSRDAAIDADLVELRLDLVERPDVAGALHGRRTPVIVTCRASWEGGRFIGSEEERRRILESAIALGAEYVDVEAAAEFAPQLIASRSGRGIVASSHIFDPLQSISVLASPPCGLSAPRCRSLRFRSNRFRAACRSSKSARRSQDATADGHVLLAMGNQGVATRILAARLRNRWTFAGDGVAPGQMPASRLLQEYRYRQIDAETALYGVVGNPILHSRSPVMHNAGFGALGLNAVYVPLEARDAADFITLRRAPRTARRKHHGTVQARTHAAR